MVSSKGREVLGKGCIGEIHVRVGFILISGDDEYDSKRIKEKSFLTGRAPERERCCSIFWSVDSGKINTFREEFQVVTITI